VTRVGRQAVARLNQRQPLQLHSVRAKSQKTASASRGSVSALPVVSALTEPRLAGAVILRLVQHPVKA
jgi:hypothetical protein